MPFCPQCCHEYGEELKLCPDCNIELVDKPPLLSKTLSQIEKAGSPQDAIAQLESLLQKYRAELQRNPSERRRKWLVTRIRNIEQEILRYQESAQQRSDKVSSEERVALAAEEPSPEAQRESQKNRKNIVNIGSLLGSLFAVAIVNPKAREIFIGVAVVSTTMLILSLVIGYVAFKRYKKSFGKSVLVAFIALWVIWIINLLFELPEYFDGKLYWENTCLCFKETEEARLQRIQEEERKKRWGCPGVTQSMWDGSVRQVMGWFRENLRDPKSLEVIRWGRLVEVEGGCTIDVKYRATNAFGGYVIEQRTFFISRDGEIVILLK